MARFELTYNRIILQCKHEQKQTIQNGNKTDNLIKSIIDYIKSQPQNYDTIFTYQTIENKFKDQFKNVNHFGNIIWCITY